MPHMQKRPSQVGYAEEMPHLPAPNVQRMQERRRHPPTRRDDSCTRPSLPRRSNRSLNLANKPGSAHRACEHDEKPSSTRPQTLIPTQPPLLGRLVAVLRMPQHQQSGAGTTALQFLSAYKVCELHARSTLKRLDSTVVTGSRRLLLSFRKAAS
jgi:hypothetical protein